MVAKGVDPVKAALKIGYAKKTIRQTISRLLQDPYIEQRIRAHRDDLLAVAGVTREKVIRELARVAFADMSQVAEWGPAGATFKASVTLPEDVRRTVKSIKHRTTKDGEEMQVLQHDKLKALRELAEMGDWLPKDKSGGQDLPNLVVADITVVYAGDSDPALESGKAIEVKGIERTE